MEDALGNVVKGALDADGHAVVAGLSPGPLQVVFGDDPADPAARGSFMGFPEWPRKPPTDVPATLKTLADNMVAASNTAQQLAAAMPGGAAGSIQGAIAGLAAASLPQADLLSAGIKGAAALTGGNMEAAVGLAQRGLSAVSASSSLAAAGGALADMAPPTSVVSLGKKIS